MRLAGFLLALRRSVGLLYVILRGFVRYRKVLRAEEKDRLRAKLAWMQGMSRSFLEVLGCDVHVAGNVPTHGLIVSNHLSYVDIIAIGSVCPAVFVAKSDVRDWPVFGRLSEMAGAIFVERGRARSIRDQLAAITEPLSAGFPVVVFPEGTSSDGARVLPFHGALLEAARHTEKPVAACALRYELEGSGSVAREVCYWGDMVFAPHLFRLLSKKSLRAVVYFGPPRPLVADRKCEARRFQAEVTALLQMVVS